MKKIKLIGCGIFMVLALALAPAITNAQSSGELQRQIDELNAQISQSQAVLQDISGRANTLQNKVDGLNAEIAGLQATIDKASLEIQQTQDAINEAIIRLEKAKKVMFENAKTLYKQGNPSTIEILASSDSFSEFVNRQEYLESVKDTVNKSAREIIALKDELETKQKDLQEFVQGQEAARQLVEFKRNEQANILAQTRGDEAAYQQLVEGQQSRVAELRRQQAAINLAGQRYVSSGGCGGYPAIWCNAPMDSMVDDWGMYNRECVSYTAWRVAASGRHMPYWGGRGNANQWDESAQVDGIPTGSQPQVGAVAISNAGEYGHAMYVEAINSDGTIRVSQFNAGWDGNYSVADRSPAGLVFIYF